MSDGVPGAFWAEVAGGPDGHPALFRLARHGIPDATLERAASRARDCGAHEDEVLLATGAVSEDALYRALAAEVGLPFLEPGFAAAPLCYRKAIGSGLVPLAGSCDSGARPGRFAFAPRGADFADLLARGRAAPAGLAVTTPTALRDAVFEARAERIARDASEALPRSRPEDSFYGGLTLGQIVASHLICIGLTAAIALAGEAAVAALLFAMSFPFLGLTSIKIAAALEPVPIAAPRRPRLPDADLPVYTVLVPLNRETEVLTKLLTALQNLDYPALWSKCTKTHPRRLLMPSQMMAD